MKKSTNANGDGGRGNAKDRARRRAWLVKPEAGFGGNGTIVACASGESSTCRQYVDVTTMEVDRIIPGCLGGRYTRDNIRPTCWNCNNHLSHIQKAELKQLRLAGAAA